MERGKKANPWSAWTIGKLGRAERLTAGEEEEEEPRAKGAEGRAAGWMEIWMRWLGEPK